MLSPTCPLLPAGPLGCWHRAQRWGHGPVLASPALPYYFRSPKFLPQPWLPLPGPARPLGHCTSTHGCPPPTPAPWHMGDPGAGGFVCPRRKVEGWEHWSIPLVVSITWIVPDPESLVPSPCRGDADAPQLTWKTSLVGNKMGSVVYPRVEPPHPHRHMGINNLDLFPGGCSKA